MLVASSIAAAGLGGSLVAEEPIPKWVRNTARENAMLSFILIFRIRRYP